jgi:ankyrin repeat protein
MIANMFWVIKRGDFDSYKADISKVEINSVNNSGASFLQTAISYKQKDIALDLIDRNINVNNQDHKGMSSLHYLGWYPNIILAEIIIQMGGNVNLKDKYGNTPLWYAVFFAKREYNYVKLLLENGADSLSLNNVGKTPLMFAQARNDQELISLMQSMKLNS